MLSVIGILCNVDLHDFALCADCIPCMNSLLLTEQSTSLSTERFRGDLNKIRHMVTTSSHASCTSNILSRRNLYRSDKDLLYEDMRGLYFCLISMEISLRESKRITWKLRNVSSKLLLLRAFNRIGKSEQSQVMTARLCFSFSCSRKQQNSFSLSLCDTADNCAPLSIKTVTPVLYCTLSPCTFVNESAIDPSPK